MKRKIFFVKIIFVLAFLAFSIGIAHGIFFVWKITAFGNKINVKSDNSASFIGTFKNIVLPSQTVLEKTTDGRINILLLGIAGKNKPGNNLADTIMIMSFDTKTGKIALLSIPRDLYAKVPETGYQNKINTLYEYGLKNYSPDEEKAIEPMKESIENITSLDINYWIVLNFEGFQKAIDAIGGINITNEKDIYDSRYPGPNYSYETFELKKGFHHLNGETALKYARMRHNDPEGDFGRAKRQQQVMQAAKNKIFSAGTLLNIVAMNNLLNALGDNIKTNISSQELEAFLVLINKSDTNNLNNVVLDAWKKESLLKVSHIFFENSRAFILIPRIGNWSEIQELAQNIFNTNEIKRMREEIEKEQATIAVINKSGDNLVLTQIISLLKDSFGYKNVVTFSDSSKNLENETFIYDLIGKNKPFTLNEIMQKLPAKTSENLETKYKKTMGNTSIDLVLVIGKDLIPRYSMAEVSFKDYNEANDANDYMEYGE